MSEEDTEIKRYVVNMDILPELYPTDKYSAQFWEHLGRAVATFSFLEGILKRAIFAFTATRRYDSAEEAEAAYETWGQSRVSEEFLTQALLPVVTSWPGFYPTRPHRHYHNSASQQ